jgi:hypothetical protein
MNIVTGEKIQQLCDIYLGREGDLNFNPAISIDKTKHLHIDNITTTFHNNYLIFCYSHHINVLSEKIHFFQNEFILITHNSDGEVAETNNVLTILNNSKLIRWFAQNVCFDHPKLFLLPIGIANNMWGHGNISVFKLPQVADNILNKSKHIFFNFNKNTNFSKRNLCYESLKNHLPWTENDSFVNYITNLSGYKFCICPEGHGVDSHRLWECLYLKVVPIVVDSPFTKILLKYNIPLVVVNSWADVMTTTLEYNKHNFNDPLFQKLIDFTPNYIHTLCNINF